MSDPSVTTNHPPLSTLLTAGALPAQLGFLENAVDDLLDGVRYSDLVIETSPTNDAKYVGVTLVVDELAVDLFGSGLRLIFLPAGPRIAFSYQWPVRRYLPDFDTLTFAHSAEAFFDLLLRILGVSTDELIDGLTDAIFPEADGYESLFAALASWNGGTSALSGLDIGDVPDDQTPVEYLLAQAAAADVDVILAAFEAIVDDIDPEAAMAKIVLLARRWLAGVTQDDLEALLLPHFSLELTDVSMALEVPRSVLVPLDADGKPLPGGCVRLTFTAGALRYDSVTGFDIGIDEGLGIDFPKSLVPGFGLIVEFDGIRVDLSRSTNIAAADAEGRPPGFMGVSIAKAVVGLPAKWFAAYQPAGGPPVTLGIVGRNLLIGTGGFSGAIGLETLVNGVPADEREDPQSGELSFVLGKKSDDDDGEDRKGFVLGFSSFDMKFQQNHLLESRIKGSLTIPGFDAGPIGIELFIGSDGDFEVTASLTEGYDLTLPGVFKYTIRSLSVGKDDRGAFLATSGEISFANNSILMNLIKKPIHLDKLLVHSDGSFEIEGGTVPLHESAVMSIGPAKITITAVHFGSHEQEHDGALRKYRYVGFDGGVSVNPGGVDARGDGICLYFTVDSGEFHCFLRIAGIGVDLVIPATASKDQAVLLLQGYLALKNPVYMGSLKFQLPQVQIAGGASMQYDTRHPAWIVDVNLELPTPIVLGSTSLGLYGFRGMFGLRYVASKTAIDPPLPEGASWGDYYRAKQDVKGVTVQKFVTPDKTKGSKNPFSVGVGVSLGTLDGGKIFSAQLLLLVSLPNLIMLEGRGDVLTKTRVGLTDDDPPYYAYLALSPESIELGVGVNYVIPKDTGELLNLNAVLEAAFFFHNSSAWYVNFGTKAKPATARIISMFDGYAYLMLSASGIETGAGVRFDFTKRYGPVGVDAHAYLDFWAYISFERSQAGGGVALGGSVDVSLFKISLHIGLAAGLTVEVPKPFRVAGSVEVCISAKLIVKTITKCCRLEFVWERSQTVNQTRVDVLTSSGPRSAVAVHMVSGSTYPVTFSASEDPPQQLPADLPIPVDSYIDVKFAKPVDPSAVAGRIGGYTSPASNATELLPPRFGSRRVRHTYALDDVKVQVLGSGGWEDYHPYTALAPGSLLAPEVLTDLERLPLGVWQKKDAGYSQIRFLALTPFSWMSPAGGYRPEEMGVTAQSTYCVARAREERCVAWEVPAKYDSGTDYLRSGVFHRVDGDRMEAVALGDPRLRPVSLAIGPAGRANFQFLEPVVRCRLRVVTTSPSIRVRWQRRTPMTATPPGEVSVPATTPEFEDAVPPVVLSSADLANPVVYDEPGEPIERIVIETPLRDAGALARLAEEIERRSDDWIRFPKDRPAITRDIARLQEQLRMAHVETCLPQPPGGVVDTEAIGRLTAELARLRAEIEKQSASYQKLCGPAPGAGRRLTPEQCRAMAAGIAKMEEGARTIEGRIKELQKPGPRFPPGWECGTFVREICWLSETDFAFNLSIPQLDAIETDFDAMRAAVEHTIAPVWRPEETYRITLQVSDRVQGPTVDASEPRLYYVHFRTAGPLGHFTDIPTGSVPPLSDDDIDDGRPEVPERALRYYIDMQRSVPDPSGRLLYAKPLYYNDVVLRLFFDKPHAYHFFADWPGGGPSYALELAVKDPAEAAAPRPDAPAHEAAIKEGPTLGDQMWPVDDSPKIAEELKVLRNFQHPKTGDQNLVCLTSGGSPITPLGKFLQAEMGDLEPNKLYTAVVLNRRTGGPVAEVHSYGFKTSLYPDFASHIASCKLTDDAGNARLAVFDIEHLLPGQNEAAILAAALEIVTLAPSADTLAYPDPFDRLVYGLLQLDPLPPPVSLEFNFVTTTAGTTYGIWLRSREPLFDPRLPAATVTEAIRIRAAGQLLNCSVLLSRDRSQAFVMIAERDLPTERISFEFIDIGWDGGLAGRPSVSSDAFSRP